MADSDSENSPSSFLAALRGQKHTNTQSRGADPKLTKLGEGSITPFLDLTEQTTNISQVFPLVLKAIKL